MSTTAVPPPTTATDRTRTLTWRDAVTPLSRASRRRWTACYALLLMLLAASFVDNTFVVEQDGSSEQILLVVIVALLVVFGMLRRGTRRIAALDHPDLDERDIEARNSAYRVAFPLLVLVVVAALVLLAVSMPDIERTIRSDPEVTVITEGWFIEPKALIGLGLWIGLWAIFLPTGTLAWREPDALEPEAGGAGLAEPIRDALLGVALVGGIAFSLIANIDVSVLPFIAVLALLGGLARRAGGQSMMSRQRKWRVAIGIVLLLILVAIAVTGATASDSSERGGGGRSSSTTR